MIIQNVMDHIETTPETFVMVLGGTVVLVLVFVVSLLYKTRNRLNWYEQNMLDMTTPLHVRCASFNRTDTEDDVPFEPYSTGPSHFVGPTLCHYDMQPRPQKTFIPLVNPFVARLPKMLGLDIDFGVIMGYVDYIRSFHSRFASIAESSSSFLDPMRDPNALQIPKGDLSGLFTIPQAKKKNRSMFTNPHQNQFDRGMYQCQMADESACSSVTMTSTGSIQLSVSHDINLNLLTVAIKQAIDLPSKREDDNPNPYLRVSVEVPDANTPKAEHQTKTFTANASPAIEEEFYFQVTPPQVGQCRLEIMVYDYDQFSVDECVGYCWLTLGRLNVSSDQNVPTVFWAEVLPVDENEGKGFGEVLFSLSYLSHAQRLSMNIFKVRNIRRNEGNISLRVTLLSGIEKKLKKKKTSSRKLTRSVQFNECLTFGIPKHTLCDVLLEIELVLETGTFGMVSQTLARMQLPLHKCKDLWRAIIREEKSQARWYPLEHP